jgi:hypothetical protein
MRNKLTESSARKSRNRISKDVCVNCRKAPREGTYKKKGKDTPYRTCAACQVKSREAAALHHALDAAEVAEAREEASGSQVPGPTPGRLRGLRQPQVVQHRQTGLGGSGAQQTSPRLGP